MVTSYTPGFVALPKISMFFASYFNPEGSPLMVMVGADEDMTESESCIVSDPSGSVCTSSTTMLISLSGTPFGASKHTYTTRLRELP